MSSALDYIKSIDSLRALAVLGVLLFHVNPSWLAGGFVGVDVFFVISGFVVTHSLLRRDRGAGFFSSIIDFYERRILRLLPALMICLVLTTVFVCLFIPPSWLSDSFSRTGQYSVIGLGNYAQLVANDGYFAPRAEFNPYTHTWSLGIEEQFYLAFPFLFFLFSKNTRHQGFIIAITLLSISSLFWSSYQSTHNSLAAFYLITSRFWELGAGCILCCLVNHYRVIMRRGSAKKLSCYAGLSMILLSMVFLKPMHHPFPGGLLPVVGTMLVILAFVSPSPKTPFFIRVFETRWIRYIGKISYSLYLWHWPLIVLMKWTVGLDTWWLKLVTIISSFLLAIVSYHGVESIAARLSLKTRWKRGGVMVAGLCLLFLSLGVVRMMFYNRDVLTLSQVGKNIDLWYPRATSFPKAENSPYEGRKVFALGDSHTGAYLRMLSRLRDDLGVQLEISNSGGRSIVGLLEPDKFDYFSEETSSGRQIANIQKHAKPGDIVFLASLRSPKLCTQWELHDKEEVLSSFFSEEQVNKREQALISSYELLDELEKLGVIVIIDTPKPILSSPPFRTMDWFNRSNPIGAKGFSYDQDFIRQVRAPILESLATITGKYSNVVIWDSFPILYDTENPSSFRDGKPLFFDGDHVSGYANDLLYPSFSEVVKNCFDDFQVK